jgi:hypothetical protein
MSITDPFTGAIIAPGTPVVRCPRGHISLPDSWQAAGNRCSYPGCEYAGAPSPGTSASGVLSSGVNVISAPTPLMSPSALNIRVISRGRARRPWWPAFWASLIDSITMLVILTGLIAIGWSILPIDTTLTLVLAAAAAPISAVILALARVFGRLK